MRIIGVLVRWISLKYAITYGLTLLVLSLYTAGLHSFADFLKDHGFDPGKNGIPSNTNFLTGPILHLLGQYELPAGLQSRLTSLDAFIRAYALDIPLLQFAAFATVVVVLQGRRYLRQRRNVMRLEKSARLARN